MPGHLHTFRHAFISHAASEGVPEAVIRSWVGHVSAEIIRLYMHIADRASQGWMQRLDGERGDTGKPKRPTKPSGSPKRKRGPGGKQDGQGGG